MANQAGASMEADEAARVQAKAEAAKKTAAEEKAASRRCGWERGWLVEGAAGSGRRLVEGVVGRGCGW